MTRISDRALRVGTEAHYLDAAAYDRRYRARREDVAFYVERARGLGPVLELGCGTGRVSFALAREGIEVVGVDASPTMLARAEEVRARAPRAVRDRVRFVDGDVRDSRIGAKFELVIAPFNVWMHLYTDDDLDRGFATARAHVRRGGRFVFDVRVPDAAELARDPGRLYRARPVVVAGQKLPYAEAFQYDPIAQVQLVTMWVGDHAVPLAHRQLFPAELIARVQAAGLRVVERFGDFAGGPLDASSEVQILECALSGK